MTYHIPLPKCKRTATETPTTIGTAKTIGSVTSHKILCILFDSGSRKTLIKRSALPWGTKPKKLSTSKTLTTLAGNVAAAEVIIFREIRLPEFDKKQTYQRAKGSCLWCTMQIWYHILHRLFNKSWYQHQLWNRFHGVVWMYSAPKRSHFIW